MRTCGVDMDGSGKKKRYTKKYISNELYFLRVTQDLPYVNMLGDTPNLLLNAKEK